MFWLHVCTPHVCSPCISQKRVSEQLELELQIVCCYAVVLGIQTWILVRALSVLNSGAISPEPFKVFFLLIRLAQQVSYAQNVLWFHSAVLRGSSSCPSQGGGDSGPVALPSELLTNTLTHPHPSSCRAHLTSKQSDITEQEGTLGAGVSTGIKAFVFSPRFRWISKR